MREYYTKAEAISNIQEGERLYARDYINKKGDTVKKFFVANVDEIVELLGSDHHIYEHYGYNKESIKLFLDIDYKCDDYDENVCGSKEELLENIIIPFEEYVNECGFDVSNKIVLDGSTTEKYSYHIVYGNIIFTTIQNMKDFIMEFLRKTETKYMRAIDNSVYGDRCLRCVNQTKIKKNNPLVGDCEVLDTLLLCNGTRDCVIFERQIDEKAKPRRFVRINKNRIMENSGDTEDNNVVKLTEQELYELMDIMSFNRCHDYEPWYKIMFALRSGGNKNFPIFDWFSRKSDKYDENRVKYMWYINKRSPSYTYCSLLFWAKQDNCVKYSEFIKNRLVDKSDELMKVGEVLEVERDYLLPIEWDENDIVCMSVDRFMTDEQKKALVVQSTYNTGKTNLLKHLCEQIRSVNYVSYRVSLSNNIHGVLDDMELYTENINADRLICQLDSFPKLRNVMYDMIIMDESSSLLAHLDAATIKDPREIYQIMMDLMHNAKKIIFLDGDIDNRTMHLVKDLNTMMIINKKKKDNRHYKFRRNEKDFIKLIDKDLERGLNVVLIVMSESKANAYYEKYKDKYTTMKYTSKTGDADKKDLCRVEEIWVNLQLLIYTNTIEAGVSFNVDHFDKMYVIISGHSTSQRGLMQMLHRVRRIRNCVVECLCYRIPLKTETYSRYTYSEMLMFYNTMCNAHDRVLNEHNQIEYVGKTEYDTYDEIKMRNMLEILNKSDDCFIPLFIADLIDKGHTYEIIEDKQCRKADELNCDMREYILNAEQISEEEYNEKMRRQREMTLTEKEKWEIKKHEYEMLFEVEMNDKKVVDTYYNKMHMVENAMLLCDIRRLPYGSVEIYRINTTKEILRLLGVEIKDLYGKGKEVSIEHLKTVRETTCKLILDNVIIYGVTRNGIPNTTRTMMNDVNSVLTNYGITAEWDRTTIRKNGKVKPKTEYTFKWFDDIEKILIKNTNKNRFWDCSSIDM